MWTTPPTTPPTAVGPAVASRGKKTASRSGAALLDLVLMVVARRLGVVVAVAGGILLLGVAPARAEGDPDPVAVASAARRDTFVAVMGVAFGLCAIGALIYFRRRVRQRRTACDPWPLAGELEADAAERRSRDDPVGTPWAEPAERDDEGATSEELEDEDFEPAPGYGAVVPGPMVATVIAYADSEARTRASAHRRRLATAAGAAASAREPQLVLPGPRPGVLVAVPARPLDEIAEGTMAAAAHLNDDSEAESPADAARVCPRCGRRFGLEARICPRDAEELAALH